MQQTKTNNQHQRKTKKGNKLTHFTILLCNNPIKVKKLLKPYLLPIFQRLQNNGLC